MTFIYTGSFLSLYSRLLGKYDTIEEFNVDSKAEYAAQSSTRMPETKTNKAVPRQVKIREVSPEVK